jgi:hypothetical protein
LFFNDGRLLLSVSQTDSGMNTNEPTWSDPKSVTYLW